MVKFKEAHARKYKNIFICKVCKAKIRAPNMKVIQGKVKCRKCKKKSLRPVRKK